MSAGYIAVTSVAIAANGFSGVAALVHFKPILPGMTKAGVPVSWLTFPIGTLKTTGAVGLAAGLASADHERPAPPEEADARSSPTTSGPLASTPTADPQGAPQWHRAAPTAGRQDQIRTDQNRRSCPYPTLRQSLSWRRRRHA